MLFKNIFWVGFISLFLTNCDSVKSAVGIKQSKVWLEKVNFRAAPNANDSSPVKIHVVIAYKEDLAATISKMDANTYFQKAKTIKSDAGDDLDVFGIDVVPGSSCSLEINPSNSTGILALMFARYTSPGDHRNNVSADYEIQFDLDKNDLKITTIKKG
jgi:hypothetical protein